MNRMISDGFGTSWHKCDREDCGLQIVRPGKAQCAHGEPCPSADEWMRKNFPGEVPPATSEGIGK